MLALNFSQIELITANRKRNVHDILLILMSCDASLIGENFAHPVILDS